MLKGDFTVIIQKEIDLTQPLTSEQQRMLDDLSTRPINSDDDCPELTTEQLYQFSKEAEKTQE